MLISELDAASALHHAFKKLPELTEHEKATIIHELANEFKALGVFNENEFARIILK